MQNLKNNKKEKNPLAKKALKMFHLQADPRKRGKGRRFPPNLLWGGTPPPKTEHGNEAPLYHAFPHLVRLQMSREERPGLGVRVALWSWAVRSDNLRRADSLPPSATPSTRPYPGLHKRLRSDARGTPHPGCGPRSPRKEKRQAPPRAQTSSSCSCRCRVRPGRQPGLAQHQRPLPLPLDARPH